MKAILKKQSLLLERLKKRVIMSAILLIFFIIAVSVIRLAIKSPEPERFVIVTRVAKKSELKPEPVKKAISKSKPISRSITKPKPKPAIKHKPESLITASFKLSPEKLKYISTPDGGNFTIEVQSNTAWTVRCDKDWLELEPLSGNQSVRSVTAAYSANTGAKERSAVITFVPAGAAEKTILVTQKGAASTMPEVSTGKAVNITDNTYVVSGAIEDFGKGYDSVSQHGHCWSETSREPTINNSKTELGGISKTGSFKSTLTDLRPFNIYYVRAYATNETGTGYGRTVELSAPLSEGLLAYYPFDGNAEDFSGNGLHGTVNGGVKLTTDRSGNPGYAYSFDGASGYITLGDYFDNTPTLTFSFWAYINSSAAVPFVAKYDTRTSLGAYYIDSSDNKVGIGVRDNLNNLLARTSNASVPNNTWVHIAGIFDLTQIKAEDRLKIYCNSVLQDLTYQSTSDVKSIPDIPLPLDIGRYTLSSGAKLYMNGILDEMCIYNRVLSEQEIKNIYNRRPDTPLVASGFSSVATGETSGITNKTAKITGYLNSFGRNSSGALEHGHCWSSTIAMPTVDDSETTILGIVKKTGDFLSELTGLQPETKYYIRAYATNSAGTAYGEVTDFTTLQNPYLTVTMPASWSIYTNPDSVWKTSYQDDTQNEFFSSSSFRETRSVCISGNYAYVAENRGGGMRIIDFSVPSKPSSSGFLNISGTAANLFLSGGYAYILSIEQVEPKPGQQGRAHNNYKLQKIDVSDPANPYVAVTYVITDESELKQTGLNVAGNYAYLTISPNLYIIDISKAPSRPYTTYDCSPDGASGVYIEGDYAYVANGKTGGLRIINVSDPNDPKITGVCNTAAPAGGVFAFNFYAFVAAGLSGLQVIDKTDPSQPRLSASVNTSGTAESVFVHGNYAYVAAGKSGLQIIDVSDPLNPQKAGGYDTPGYASEVAVSGCYAYVADGTGGLQVIQLGPFYQGAPSYRKYTIKLLPVPR